MDVSTLHARAVWAVPAGDAAIVPAEGYLGGLSQPNSCPNPGGAVSHSEGRKAPVGHGPDRGVGESEGTSDKDAKRTFREEVSRRPTDLCSPKLF